MMSLLCRVKKERDGGEVGLGVQSSQLASLRKGPGASQQVDFLLEFFLM
jgi:hypothetical protein